MMKDEEIRETFVEKTVRSHDFSVDSYLRALFLDFFNNYLTIELFAEHHDIDEDIAQRILDLGRRLHEKYVERLETSRISAKNV